jgi:hypothetical protein
VHTLYSACCAHHPDHKTGLHCNDALDACDKLQLLKLYFNGSTENSEISELITNIYPGNHNWTEIFDMTWLQNKEINYSTPSLYPSPYAQECTRTCHAHTNTNLCKKRVQPTHPTHTHTHTKQNKQGRRNLFTFLVCMQNVNSHIDKDKQSTSTKTRWNNLKQSIKIWVRMELPETFHQINLWGLNKCLAWSAI